MAKVIIEAISTANIWHFTEVPELRIYSNENFISDGAQVLAGNPLTDEPHLKIPCQLSGANTLLIPSFEIDSTPLTLPAYHTARYTAILKTANYEAAFLESFAVPPEPAGMNWDFLRTYQYIGRRFSYGPTAEHQAMITSMIADALTFLRYASETQVGMSALDEDPADPNFPIAVGVNSPLLSSGNWLSNDRIAVVAAYDLMNSDKGKTVALGGGTYYTLTVDAATEFDADFQVLVLNEDTARAKKIAVDGLAVFLLYPGQIAQLYNQNNVWRVFKPNRWRIPASCTVFVDSTNGNDNNDGLAAGAGGALLTIQAAINLIKADFDLSGPRATPVVIQLADGTYNGGANPVAMVSGPFVGQQQTTYIFPSTNEVPVSIRGNAAAPSNVVLTSNQGLGTVLTVWGGVIGIQDCKITNTGFGKCFEAGGFAGVQFGNVVLGATGGAKVVSEHGSIIESYSNFFLEGNSQYAFQADYLGSIYLTGVMTVLADFTVTDFAFVARSSDLTIQAATINLDGHTVTGRRFQVRGSGSITHSTQDVAGTYFPGTTPGIIVGDGVYSDLSGRDFTPVVTSTVGAITALGAVTGRYTRPFTNFHMIQVDLVITTNGTGAGFVRVTLPEPAAGFRYVLQASNFSNGEQLQARVIDTDPTSVYVMKPDNSYPGADNTRIVISGWYEST